MSNSNDNMQSRQDSNRPARRAGVIGVTSGAPMECPVFKLTGLSLAEIVVGSTGTPKGGA